MIDPAQILLKSIVAQDQGKYQEACRESCQDQRAVSGIRSCRAAYGLFEELCGIGHGKHLVDSSEEAALGLDGEGSGT